MQQRSVPFPVGGIRECKARPEETIVAATLVALAPAVRILLAAPQRRLGHVEFTGDPSQQFVLRHGFVIDGDVEVGGVVGLHQVLEHGYEVLAVNEVDVLRIPSPT